MQELLDEDINAVRDGFVHLRDSLVVGEAIRDKFGRKWRYLERAEPTGDHVDKYLLGHGEWFLVIACWPQDGGLGVRCELRVKNEYLPTGKDENRNS